MAKIAVVDLETGENVSQQYRLMHVNQTESFKQRTRERSPGRARDFTFSSMLNIADVIARVDDKYCGYLLYLQTFINYKGRLVTTQRPLNREDIRNLLGLQRRAFSDFFKAMTDNEIIQQDGEYYRINPAYHFRGSTDNQHVIKAFTTRVRSMYGMRNAKKLGFVYKLLPYVHYETNTICANPFENELADVKRLTHGELAALTGVSEKTVYNYLRSMKFGDEFVFAEVAVGREKFYKINPFIFYRKNGEPDATLREMFLVGFRGRK